VSGARVRACGLGWRARCVELWFQGAFGWARWWTLRWIPGGQGRVLGHDVNIVDRGTAVAY
jgi:hypothetical protein